MMKFILTASKNTAINLSQIGSIDLCKPLGDSTSWTLDAHLANGAGPFRLRTGTKAECQKFFKSIIEDYLLHIEEE